MENAYLSDKIYGQFFELRQISKKILRDTDDLTHIFITAKNYLNLCLYTILLFTFGQI